VNSGFDIDFSAPSLFWFAPSFFRDFFSVLIFFFGEPRTSLFDLDKRFGSDCASFPCFSPSVRPDRTVSLLRVRPPRLGAHVLFVKLGLRQLSSHPDSKSFFWSSGSFSHPTRIYASLLLDPSPVGQGPLFAFYPLLLMISQVYFFSKQYFPLSLPRDLFFFQLLFFQDPLLSAGRTPFDPLSEGVITCQWSKSPLLPLLPVSSLFG